MKSENYVVFPTFSLANEKLGSPRWHWGFERLFDQTRLPFHEWERREKEKVEGLIKNAIHRTS